MRIPMGVVARFGGTCVDPWRSSSQFASFRIPSSPMQRKQASHQAQRPHTWSYCFYYFSYTDNVLSRGYELTWRSFRLFLS